MKTKMCEARGCKRTDYAARGYCSMHYKRLNRNNTLEARPKYPQHGLCAAPNCERESKIRSHCRKHYMQIRRHGTLTPEKEYTPQIGLCNVPSCIRNKVTKGYCGSHYAKNYAKYKNLV